MRLHTSIEYINAEVDKISLLIASKKTLEVLSSAVLNGGFVKANCIININVSEYRDEEIHRDPKDLLKKALVKLGLAPEKVVGLMTSVDVRNVVVSEQKYHDTTLSTFVTAGIGFSATAGEATASKQNSYNAEKAGTINIILLIDGNLTNSCMVDVVKTATEAKTVALMELDVRSRYSGDLASGEVTDSVVVACTKRGSLIEYAGTGTAFGELIGKSVKESVKKALQKQGKVIANRTLTERLDERGISLAKMITHFSESHSSILGTSEKLKKFREQVQQALSDPIVTSLVIAALRLDDDAKMGLIQVSMHDKNVVSGILQNAVANHLSRKSTQSKHLKLDDTNLSGVERLGPITRSVLLTIISCAYSYMYDHSSN
jgi:adenosylcobinamide hydrolase